MIILTLYILSKIKNKVRLLAYGLSFLVSLHVVGTDFFQEEIEKEQTEEVKEIECAINEAEYQQLQKQDKQSEHARYLEGDSPLNVGKVVAFSLVPKKRYYLLYRQLVYYESNPCIFFRKQC